jgi:hypothetical protein
MNLFLKALLQIQLILDNPAKRTLIAPVFKIKLTVNNWRKVRFIKLTSHKFWSKASSLTATLLTITKNRLKPC